MLFGGPGLAGGGTADAEPAPGSLTDHGLKCEIDGVGNILVEDPFAPGLASCNLAAPRRHDPSDR